VIERIESARLWLWTLSPTGPVAIENRRVERRVPVSGAVSLTCYPHLGPRALLATANDPRPLTGSLIDISPSAVQCAVATDGISNAVHAGTVATYEFEVNG